MQSVGPTPRRSSSGRGRFASTGAEPPSRLSSILAGGAESNEEQAHALPFAIPGPIPQANGVANVGRQSVDFALPYEMPRRESLDSGTIRKSFDALVSPFRGAKKNARRKAVMGPGEVGSPSPPILRSPSMDMAPNPVGTIPSTLISQQTRPLSSVQDEQENEEPVVGRQADVWDRPNAFSPPDSGREGSEVSGQTPLASERRVGGETTEDGDDFYDANSDEGGNGSSGGETRQSKRESHGSQSTLTKRKAKRKSVESHNAARARAKSAVSGLGVEAFEPFPPALGGPAGKQVVEGLDSSASEAELAGKHDLRLASPVGSQAEERTTQFAPASLDVPALTQLQEDSSADIKVAGSIEAHPETPARQNQTPEEQWRERFDANTFYLPRTTSSRSLGLANRASPPFSTLLPVSQSTQSAFVRDGDGTAKTIGRSGRGLAGVMARIRKDRGHGAVVDDDATSPSFSNEPFRSSRNNASAVGLGIAAPDVEVVEVPQRRWRSRLVSLSAKSAKSVKVGQDEYAHDRIPAMPPKARKLLLANSGSAESNELARRQQVMEEAISQTLLSNKGAHTSPLESREFTEYPSTGSPTIHKSLSPALLTQQYHEADEVVSFVGSDRDSEGKRATWNSLSKYEDYELPPDQTADTYARSPSAQIGLHVTRPSFEVESRPTSAVLTDEAGFGIPRSMTERRFSSGRERIIRRSSEGLLRKAPPSALDLSPPRPIRAIFAPASKEQQSPIVRSSFDTRRPLWPRKARLPSDTPDSGKASSSFALDRDRSPQLYQGSPTPSTPFKEPLHSPRAGKRLFSGAKAKAKAKGISSSDYVDAQGMSPSSESRNGYVHPLSSPLPQPPVPSATSREEQEQMLKRNSDLLEGMNGGVLKAHEATKLLAVHMNSMAITPTSSHTSSFPPTPNLHSVPDEESSHFDRMLRESAQQDAARLKQIASRTATQAKDG